MDAAGRLAWLVPPQSQRSPITFFNWPLILVPMPFLVVQVHILLRYTTPHVQKDSVHAKLAHTVRVLLALPTIIAAIYVTTHFRFDWGDEDGKTGKPLLQHFNVAIGIYSAYAIIKTLEWASLDQAPQLAKKHTVAHEPTPTLKAAMPEAHSDLAPVEEEPGPAAPSIEKEESRPRVSHTIPTTKHEQAPSLTSAELPASTEPAPAEPQPDSKVAEAKDAAITATQPAVGATPKVEHEPSHQTDAAPPPPVAVTPPSPPLLPLKEKAMPALPDTAPLDRPDAFAPVTVTESPALKDHARWDWQVAKSLESQSQQPPAAIPSPEENVEALADDRRPSVLTLKGLPPLDIALAMERVEEDAQEDWAQDVLRAIGQSSPLRVPASLKPITPSKEASSIIPLPPTPPSEKDSPIVPSSSRPSSIKQRSSKLTSAFRKIGRSKKDKRREQSVDDDDGVVPHIAAPVPSSPTGSSISQPRGRSHRRPSPSSPSVSPNHDFVELGDRPRTAAIPFPLPKGLQSPVILQHQGEAIRPEPRRSSTRRSTSVHSAARSSVVGSVRSYSRGVPQSPNVRSPRHIVLLPERPDSPEPSPVTDEKPPIPDVPQVPLIFRRPSPLSNASPSSHFAGDTQEEAVQGEAEKRQSKGVKPVSEAVKTGVEPQVQELGDKSAEAVESDIEDKYPPAPTPAQQLVEDVREKTALQERAEAHRLELTAAIAAHVASNGHALKYGEIGDTAEEGLSGPIGAEAKSETAAEMQVPASEDQLKRSLAANSLVSGAPILTPIIEVKENPASNIRTGATPLPANFPGTFLPLELDYLTNMRGVGWQWGIPSPAGSGIEAVSPGRFTAESLTRFVLCSALLDVLVSFIQAPEINPAGSRPGGGSLWEAKNGVLGYVGVGLLVYALGAVVYASIQGVYSLLSALAVLGGLPPSYFSPPPFHRPFNSTSLQSLWTLHWHPLFRSPFLAVGYKPFRAILRPYGRDVARAGGLFAVFLLSGVLHEMGQMGMLHPHSPARSVQWGVTTLFFVLQWVGTMLEVLYEQKTGNKVRGPWGWAWCYGWMIVTGVLPTDTWFRLGLASGIATPRIADRLARHMLKAFQ